MAQVDLNDIKTQIKSILDTANTTTASIPLANGMVADRIELVAKTNLERIPIESGCFPAVTCWIDSKSLAPETIAKSQAVGTRKAIITVRIAGLVYLDSYDATSEDPSDEECEKLMENIEEILRNNDTLNNTVLRHMITDTEYLNNEFDEQTHMRVGISAMQIIKFY